MTENTVYELSVDWLNVTMSPREKYKIGADGQPIITRNGNKMILDAFYDVDWTDKAENIIARICSLLGLGAEIPLRKNAQGNIINPLGSLGYTVCKQFGDVLVGYHKQHEYMGIIVQLSGDACRAYRGGFSDDDKRVPELVLVKTLKQIATDNDYMCAPTRVDIALDEYDGACTVPQYIDEYYIKPKAEERKPYIYTYRERANVTYGLANVSTSTIMSEGATLYVGSPKSACRLRIYDKLAERKSADAVAPLNVDSWVRYELVLKKEYARAMGDVFAEMAVDDDKRYMRYLASILGTKYVLCLDEDGLRKQYVMQYLNDVADGIRTILKSDDRRTSTLVTSYSHIVGKSGLVGLAQKMVAIHDDKDAHALVDALLLALRKEILSAPITEDTARAIAKADKAVDVLPADVVREYGAMLKTESTED